MRMIDADAFIDKLARVPMIQEAIKKAMDSMPTVEAIPIDFIESEKRFVSELSSQAYEARNIKRAKGLSNVALNLDALISNWGFIRGDEWRENRKKAMKDD